RTRLGGIEVRRNSIGKRVTDELCAHTVLVVELLLEREQAQNEIDCLADRANAPLPPRPDLGADVLHGGDSGRLDARREPSAELLRNDPEGPVRTRFQYAHQ